MDKKENEYTWCFACGKDNPIGLKLDMQLEGETCTAVFLPQRQHQSYDNCMHGGLISTILDEVMGHYVFKKTGMPAYTADLHIRFREAVPIGEEIRVVGRLKSQRNRLYLMEGIVYKATGAVAATAEAKLMAEK